MYPRRAGLLPVFCVATAQLFLTACQDSGQSPPARPDVPVGDPRDGSMLAPLDLVYVCGNKFLVTNATPATVELTYRVVGANETGRISVRQGTGEDPGYSETEMETASPGEVELYQDDRRVARRRNEALPCGAPALSASVAAAGNESTVGSWTAPFSWPVVAVHLIMGPSGKVLSWGKDGAPQLWNPATKTFTAVPTSTWLFCAGHALLADGRLLVAGGHIADDRGLPDVNLFAAYAGTWASAPRMARGRWYPTVTTLANGEAVVIAGRDETGTVVTVPEVWTGTGWRALSGASRSLPYYPRTFLAPNGQVFYAGERQATAYLSTSGAGGWTSVGNRLYGTRDYGSAVMYEPGKILYVGGGRTTRTAETIDLTQPAPVWKWTGSMAVARRHLNATVLPDGTVLVTGGTSGTTFSDEALAVRAAELWDPGKGVWTTLASSSVGRVYHATSLLLLDGRVLHTGSGDGAGITDRLNAEIFSPPYLYKGARPSISSSPGSAAYGTTFFVGTANPAAITRVTLIRPGTVTHAFDSNQRFVSLAFTPASGGLNVTIPSPSNRNLAPPGHYMLFILNGNNVPSVGKIIRLK
jgi:galactose oxidase